MGPQDCADRAWVRELAGRVAEIANAEKNELVKRRWRDVNALRRPDRAPVWCRPVGAWDELLPEGALCCHDPWLRSVERALRMMIVKDEVDDDSPVEPFFAVEAVFRCDPSTVWGPEARRREPDSPGGSWAFDPPLRVAEDFDKLRHPHLFYDVQTTQERLARAHDLLGDILAVRLVCDAPLTATLGTPAAELRGLTQMMLDMAVEPRLMHRLMGHLRDGVLLAMDQVEATGLLTPNNYGPMTCSDPVGPEPVRGGRYGYGNMWVMSNSQEFDPVSPAMWQEFCLDYQRPIIERFGLSAYGCCENLTHKIEGVLSLSNLRIFVCSAWTNLDRVVERVGADHVIMWRQKASDVVFAADPSVLRRDLEKGLERLKGCYVQVVLRELQTLAGHPDRLHVWTRLAKAAAEKYA